MRERKTNYAFIDSQNLHLGIRALGWKLDFGRFRRYLSDKYSVVGAFLFIGYLPGNEPMYENLRRQGFELVFKDTSLYRDNSIKGNTDAEMILHTTIKMPLYDKAVIVTGDSDFYCLTEYLIANSKLEKLLIPNQNHYASIFRKLGINFKEIADFVGDKQSFLAYKTKSADPRRNMGGAFPT